ncbi:MAG: hypothetical protein GW905_12050 [Rhodobacterales bacterium]|nr:hypothetical protein [Rhodobacterales bacterium]
MNALDPAFASGIRCRLNVPTTVQQHPKKQRYLWWPNAHWPPPPEQA